LIAQRNSIGTTAAAKVDEVFQIGCIEGVGRIKPVGSTPGNALAAKGEIKARG